MGGKVALESSNDLPDKVGGVLRNGRVDGGASGDDRILPDLQSSAAVTAGDIWIP